MTHVYNRAERFIVFAEQLDIACGLLAGGDLARVRAALVAFDNLAHILLDAHAEQVFAASERNRWLPNKRFGQRDRERIKRDFRRMAALAGADYDGPPLERLPRLLDDNEVIVARIAHTARNGVYHADRHNPVLLGPLTVLYAKAIGAAFLRAQDHGHSAYSVNAAQAARLAALGYEPKPDSIMRATIMLNFCDAARTIVATTTGPLVVDDEGLKELLSEDAVSRAQSAAQTVDALLADGMPEERLTFSFFWTQFWARHGADDQWLELGERRELLDKALRDRSAGHRSSRLASLARRNYLRAATATAERLDRFVSLVSRRLRAYAKQTRREALNATPDRLIERAYISRGHDLQRGFEPEVAPFDGASLRTRGLRLRHSRSTTALLDGYEQLDRRLEAFENATGAAADSWSRLIQNEIDGARGK